MRSSWKTFVAAAASLLLVPQLAAADDVQDQLRQMQERMSQMEDRLQATTEELDKANQRVEDQEKLIERSGLADERSGLSSLSRFLQATEFSGVVAASYNWNLNDPKNGLSTTENVGVAGLTSGFHPKHNTFQLDQALFSMVKPSTEESRGGFGVDIAFGVAADSLNGGTAGTGDDSFIYQAYASYLAPVMDGVLIKAGRYETVLGAEVFRVGDNFNITRGLVYGLQPTSHTGAMMSTELGGLEWSFGVANNHTNTMVDADNAKTMLARVGWSGETASMGLSWMLGDDVLFSPAGPAPAFPRTTKDSDVQSLLDLVTTWDPSDNLSIWLNFDWLTQRNDGVNHFNIYGTAVAGRLAITEATGLSTRFEWIRGEDVCRASGGAPSACASGLGFTGTDDVDLYSITGTLDHALTDHLTARMEARYDWGKIQGGNNDIFISSDLNGPATLFGGDDQILLLAQMYYSF